MEEILIDGVSSDNLAEFQEDDTEHLLVVSAEK
jgi:hypothetical protein